MAAALEKLPRLDDPRVLVGFYTSDDAGVIKLDDHTALIQTVDFFTPIVDDPYTYGQIAAANSLSDVYAMGGEPLVALNIVGFPKDLFPLDVLGEILKGGQDKAFEAGISIIGGHTISDDELKYGLSVTGTVHPAQILTNSGAEPGDVLFLTKPLGTGTITTALKAGKGTPEMEKRVCELMTVLNRSAMRACKRIGVHACTDISGYGLLGHAYEMAVASRVSLIMQYQRIPILSDAVTTTNDGFVPGGTKANLLFVSSNVTFAADLSQTERYLLTDPQTSGGLLVAVEESKKEEMSAAFAMEGVEAFQIGRVAGENPGYISVEYSSHL